MKTGNTKCNRLCGSNILLSLLLASVIFVLCCLFEFFATGNSILSCFTHPTLVVTMYFEKASIAVLVSSFVFITKRRWWVIAITLLIVIWCIAELVYLQFFDSMLIDGYSVLMINNMAGFWDSIIPCLKLKYLWFLLPCAILFLLFRRMETIGTDVGLFISFLTVSLFLHLSFSIYCNEPWKKDVTSRLPLKTALNPFSDNYDTASLQYSSNYSVVHSLSRVVVELFKNDIPYVDVSQLSDCLKDKDVIGGKTKAVPNTRLFVILIESLESWAVLPEITPNICMLSEKENILWAKKVRKQTRRGQSADGQMIINTGLLPINDGAACYRFAGNVYPSISELYSDAHAFIPGGLGVWNQGMMCRAYHIDYTIETSTNDRDIITSFMEVKDSVDYGLVLTASTHSPFTAYPDSSRISLPQDMPKVMSDYLRSVNYMDDCIGSILSKIENDSVLANATIVITGDHTILGYEQRRAYSDYCKESGHIEYDVSEGYCPLIIFSRNIEKRKIIEGEIFQMDIYPTILNIIGCSDYYWRGFGVNLLDDKMRDITEDEAYSLSEQIFYSDFFKNLQ